MKFGNLNTVAFKFMYKSPFVKGENILRTRIYHAKILYFIPTFIYFCQNFTLCQSCLLIHTLGVFMDNMLLLQLLLLKLM